MKQKILRTKRKGWTEMKQLKNIFTKIYSQENTSDCVLLKYICRHKRLQFYQKGTES